MMYAAYGLYDNIAPEFRDALYVQIAIGIHQSILRHTKPNASEVTIDLYPAPENAQFKSIGLRWLQASDNFFDTSNFDGGSLPAFNEEQFNANDSENPLFFANNS